MYVKFEKIYSKLFSTIKEVLVNSSKILENRVKMNKYSGFPNVKCDA